MESHLSQGWLGYFNRLGLACFLLVCGQSRRQHSSTKSGLEASSLVVVLQTTLYLLLIEARKEEKICILSSLSEEGLFRRDTISKPWGFFFSRSQGHLPNWTMPSFGLGFFSIAPLDLKAYPWSILICLFWHLIIDVIVGSWNEGGTKQEVSFGVYRR